MLYLALFAPTPDEALTFHRIADRAYRYNYNVYGVRVETWNNDKLQVVLDLPGKRGYPLARAIAREFYRQTGSETAEISWGPEPQEPQPPVSAEDYREWVAASCGEC